MCKQARSSSFQIAIVLFHILFDRHPLRRWPKHSFPSAERVGTPIAPHRPRHAVVVGILSPYYTRQPPANFTASTARGYHAARTDSREMWISRQGMNLLTCQLLQAWTWMNSTRRLGWLTLISVGRMVFFRIAFSRRHRSEKWAETILRL